MNAALIGAAQAVLRMRAELAAAQRMHDELMWTLVNAGACNFRSADRDLEELIAMLTELREMEAVA